MYFFLNESPHINTVIRPKLKNMPHYLFILLFCCFPILTKAQFCSGTLGDNIFLEGDFGTGPANLLSPNPGIAPGYNYTFNVPPVDGQYVLTNSTAIWPGLYDTWLAIRDNSFDPNGYMMVVNASNNPGLFYQQTVSGLCENTLYEFSADIINLIKVGTPDHSDPNVSFLLNDVELFSTGNIPKTNNWINYGFTFTTAVGQQSLTLALRNNAPGGIGNDLAIDNISFRACGPETFTGPNTGVTEINLCENDTPIEFEATLLGNEYTNPAFQWQQSFDQGITWIDIMSATDDTYTPPFLTTAGSYFYRFLVADGVANLSSDKCRVNADPKIINVRPILTTQIDTILCQGQTLTVGNTEYTETGIYENTLTDFYGCDSIVITNLTIATSAAFTFDLIITPPCPNLTNGNISIENIVGGTPPFNYTFQGTDVGTTASFPDLAGGETYTIVIEDAGGCTIEQSTFIENPIAWNTTIAENSPCPNQANASISIEAVSGATPPYSYTFDGMDVGTTTFFSDLAGGQTYSIVIRDVNGCTTERSIPIENPEEWMVELIATPPCPNDTDGTISIENLSGATAPYNFTLDSVEVGTTTLFSDLAGGQTYSVVIQDAIGCTTERSVFMEDLPDLILELGEDQIVELGETVQLSPFYNFAPTDFNWQVSTPLDSCLEFSDCDKLDFLPTTSEEVILQLLIGNGCSVSDSITIQVVDVRKVYVPNIFSPNADGVNDVFTIFANTNNVILVEELKVFSRWGALVFQNNNFLPNDFQLGWNGIYKNDVVPLGVYFYTATVRFVDGKVLRYSGDVTVVK